MQDRVCTDQTTFSGYEGWVGGGGGGVGSTEPIIRLVFKTLSFLFSII